MAASKQSNCNLSQNTSPVVEMITLLQEAEADAQQQWAVDAPICSEAAKQVPSFFPIWPVHPFSDRMYDLQDAFWEQLNTNRTARMHRSDRRLARMGSLESLASAWCVTQTFEVGQAKSAIDAATSALSTIESCSYPIEQSLLPRHIVTGCKLFLLGKTGFPFGNGTVPTPPYLVSEGSHRVGVYLPHSFPDHSFCRDAVNGLQRLMAVAGELPPNEIPRRKGLRLEIAGVLFQLKAFSIETCKSSMVIAETIDVNRRQAFDKATKGTKRPKRTSPDSVKKTARKLVKLKLLGSLEVSYGGYWLTDKGRDWVESDENHSKLQFTP